MDKQYVYINGEFFEKDKAKISVFDRGVLYGDGIFEGIRLYDGIIFKCKEHMDRLYNAAKAIKLEIPVSKDEMTEIVAESCRKNNLKNGYIRLIVTRGIGDLGLDPDVCKTPEIICIAGAIQMYPEEVYEKGMTAITSSQRRNKATIVDPQIKSLNYLNNILAKIEANRAGASEAIMLNEDGIVTECTGDNIFIVKDGAIYTPPIHVGILDGITRKGVFEICKELNVPIYEKEFTLFNVYSADECFFSGSAAELIAVTNIDDRTIGDGVCGPITKKLGQAFKTITRTDGYKI